jgi:PKD repeat protein
MTDSPALAINEPGRYTLDHDLASEATVGVLINASDVVLDGMGHRVEGSGATGSKGIVVGGISPEPRVVNVTVRNLTVAHWETGIEVMRANGTVIERVVCEQNYVGLFHIGDELFPSENGVVHDSVFRNNTAVGIMLYNRFGGITTERCRVTGNGVGMAAGYYAGTLDYWGSPSLVADCDISGNQDYGLLIQEGGYSFRRGVVSAVRNCTIRGNGGDGVLIGGTTTTIVGNRVEENGGYGVNAGDSGGSNITSNWIAGNRIGVSAGGDWPSCVRNNVLNNIDNGIFGGGPLNNFYLNYTQTAGTNIVGGPYLGGNVWAFPNGTGFSQTHPDDDGDGFCDDAFVTAQGAVDYLPLAMPAVAPVPGGTGLPTSIAGNGLYDDVNGNGRKDFADIVLYFNQMGWIAANEPISAFDFNGNGRIDFADVVWLFNNLDIPPARTFTVTAVAVGPGAIIPSGNISVPEGRDITFSLENRGVLPTPYATQNGYVVGNYVLVDPTVTPTPHPIEHQGGHSSMPSYTLHDVRSNHTVYGVFYYDHIYA